MTEKANKRYSLIRRVDIRDIAVIASETNTRIEIEIEGAIYRFEPMIRGDNPCLIVDNDNPLDL
ncbi:hypothetical protein [Candidatus Liberibacter asiaticus]|uniref:hypothetical protein n=1 Tax=Liberibacter asiaticus TaxID=34021 RepID=UPI0013026F41|nr:hypothetical protein [Candidatus Liberibacter asiaticus]